MGRPGATQPHGFQRPTASSLGGSVPTSSGSSGQRGPTTAAELLAPWQERQGMGLDVRGLGWFARPGLNGWVDG